MKSSPAVKTFGKLTMGLNKNRAVVIYCDLHQEWVTAASATRHFWYSRDHGTRP